MRSTAAISSPSGTLASFGRCAIQVPSGSGRTGAARGTRRHSDPGASRDSSTTYRSRGSPQLEARPVTRPPSAVGRVAISIAGAMDPVIVAVSRRVDPSRFVKTNVHPSIFAALVAWVRDRSAFRKLQCLHVWPSMVAPERSASSKLTRSTRAPTRQPRSTAPARFERSISPSREAPSATLHEVKVLSCTTIRSTRGASMRTPAPVHPPRWTLPITSPERSSRCSVESWKDRLLPWRAGTTASERSHRVNLMFARGACSNRIPRREQSLNWTKTSDSRNTDPSSRHRSKVDWSRPRLANVAFPVHSTKAT